MANLAYKRVIIKLSGEALSGDAGRGIDNGVVSNIVSQIKKIKELGVEVGITVGGGNFWRGRQGAEMDRVTADYMGMMATVINALALRDAFERQGVPAMVMSSINVSKIAEPFETKRANKLLRDGTVLIFACGTGNPFFTTDTGAALKAIELEADVLLLAKNVDGIYSADPKTDKNAIKYADISYMDFIRQDLKAMDITAVSMCKENNMKVLAFALFEDNALLRVINGEKIGTLIK
ncbi:MAG: UMP kinase [Clostridiales bacterium]|nr:UMP kinase [Clostridiales bacterium]